MGALFETTAFLRHCLCASGPHGVHSPLVFHLITRVLPSPPQNEPALEAIAELRKKLSHSEQRMAIQDYGAGPRSGAGAVRSISDIVSTASSSPRQLAALFRFTQDLRPTAILELGCNLGLGAAALALASPQSEVWSVEGDPRLAQLAMANLNSLGIENTKVFCAQFDVFLDEQASLREKFDLVVIDGNHRKTPTLNYVELIFPLLKPNAVIILDDIHWSKEMEEAWTILMADERFCLALDFFHFGILYTRRSLRKQSFRLHLPR